MCTAIALSRGNCLFGRTLDLEYHYSESVVIAPRHFLFSAPSGHRVQGKYAIIGIATIADGYPLYYDAMNEHGLCMAGLHFPDTCAYLSSSADTENVPPYALLPRILSSCATLEEAKELLLKINLVDLPFNSHFPLTPLHWMISHNRKSIVVEPLADGIKLYDNPVSVMTNNPTFYAQLAMLQRYNGLSPYEPAATMVDPSLIPHQYRGLGCVGLPGDYSSPSRFVRGVYLSRHTPDLIGMDGITHFFRMLNGVSIPKGALLSTDGRWVYTVYTSCCDPSTCTYYYQTYHHPAIIGVKLFPNSNESSLLSYPLQNFECILS